MLNWKKIDFETKSSFYSVPLFLIVIYKTMHISTHANEDFEGSPSKVWARTSKDNRLVHANDVTKSDGPFYCPDTFDDLIVRKCIEKIDHFAYRARLSPTANRESKLHYDCKNEICSALKEIFPEGRWQVERPLPANEKKGHKALRPDISGIIGNKAVVIEVQASTLSISKINERTKEYTKSNAYILWIIPLEEELGGRLFRPRLFERHLHSMYYGRVYYWCKGYKTFLQPIHFGLAERYIELSTWYEAGGQEQSAGDYYKTYKRAKKPIPGVRIDISKDFEPHSRSEFVLEENDLKNIPSCQIWKDTIKIWWINEPARYRQKWERGEDGNYYGELEEEEFLI